jgi:hypothetical protein
MCFLLQFQSSFCVAIDEMLKFHPPSFHPRRYDVRMSTESNNHPQMYNIHPNWYNKAPKRSVTSCFSSFSIDKQ